MTNVLPSKFQLDPIFLRPTKLSNGTFRPLSPYQKLINYELLLVLNGKPVGYSLDFSLDTNRKISGYEFDNSFRPYNTQDIQNINDIFQLSETNEMFLVAASRNPGWAIYFQKDNTMSALVLNYFHLFNETNSIVNRYIVAKLHGFSDLDIEANLFCYQNGQNIVNLREQNARNMAYIISKGTQIINQIQTSIGFKNYINTINIIPVDNFSTPIISQP
jgi:hypothetical protein